MKFSHFRGESVDVGSVFRVFGAKNYEPVVDFMLVETANHEFPYGFMVATGRSAGHTFQYLPRDAYISNTRMVSAHWLKVNWGKWISLGCDLEDVYFIGRYPPPDCEG